MRVLEIKDEDCINFKEISMFVATPFCSGKCYKELGLDSSICQNDKLRNSPIVEMDNQVIIKRYLQNPLTKAIVLGGLEPLDSFAELTQFLKEFRKNCDDTIVIYTGYKENEIEDKISLLKQIGNVILKVGRYIPNQKNIFDQNLGVYLASNNQYSIKL